MVIGRGLSKDYSFEKGSRLNMALKIPLLPKIKRNAKGPDL